MTLGVCLSARKCSQRRRLRLDPRSVDASGSRDVLWANRLLDERIVGTQRHNHGAVVDPITHYTKAALISRGWTKAMVSEYLSAPDATRPWQGRRVQYFAAERVHAVEQTSAFHRSKELARSRADAVRAATQSRREATLAAVSELAFTIPVMEISDLTRRAIAAYNPTVDSRVHRANMSSDPTLLAYISVHWLRRNCSEYARAVASTKGRPGRWAAYYVLRDRLFDAIESTYPHLASECAIQRRDKPIEQTCTTVEDVERRRPRPDEIPLRFARQREAAAAKRAQAKVAGG